MRDRLISCFNYYIREFCKKNDLQCESELNQILRDLRCWLDDYFIELTDIIYDIDSEQPAGKYFEWLERNEKNHTYIKYDSFCGLKRAIKPKPEIINFAGFMTPNSKEFVIEFNKNLNRRK